MTARHLERLQRQHEKLMSMPPYPHDGWKYCQCDIAQKIRENFDAVTDRQIRRALRELRT